MTLSELKAKIIERSEAIALYESLEQKIQELEDEINPVKQDLIERIEALSQVKEVDLILYDLIFDYLAKNENCP